ncbi:MAG TPA: hypothetical protein VHU20_01065 [Candidatus Eisenbacteria bacterium]|nr:hypothetical protein [Candidatus Eisenbacteria bacterium]
MKTISLVLLALTMGVPALAQDSSNPNKAQVVTQSTESATSPADNMGILRDKLKADKKLVVAEAMGMNEKEAAAFWPVYELYQKDISALNDRTMTLLKDYVHNYGGMTDASAKGMVDSFLKIEKDRINLMQSYRPKFQKALPEVKVARYYQIENKIRAVVNYELASEIPLAE